MKMKKLIIIIILSSLLYGCGEHASNPFYQQIYNWQDRELFCIKDSQDIITATTIPLVEIECLLSWISDNIKYQSDEQDYWQTSCETLNKRTGDCEDKAILLWRLLRDQGYPQDINRIGWLRNKDETAPGHMVVILHFEKKTLIADYRHHKLFDLDSYLQKRPYYHLIFTFNLHSIWEY